eukprot:3541374-Alexandrium_andersonii.AAC.1
MPTRRVPQKRLRQACAPIFFAASTVLRRRRRVGVLCALRRWVGLGSARGRANARCLYDAERDLRRVVRGGDF